jgi:hypothetical protein
MGKYIHGITSFYLLFNQIYKHEIKSIETSSFNMPSKRMFFSGYAPNWILFVFEKQLMWLIFVCWNYIVIDSKHDCNKVKRFSFDFCKDHGMPYKTKAKKKVWNANMRFNFFSHFYASKLEQCTLQCAGILLHH